MTNEQQQMGEYEQLTDTEEQSMRGHRSARPWRGTTTIVYLRASTLMPGNHSIEGRAQVTPAAGEQTLGSPLIEFFSANGTSVHGPVPMQFFNGGGYNWRYVGSYNGAAPASATVSASFAYVGAPDSKPVPYP